MNDDNSFIVRCPACRLESHVRGEFNRSPEKMIALEIRSCDSGGIYSTRFVCESCGHSAEAYD